MVGGYKPSDMGIPDFGSDPSYAEFSHKVLSKTDGSVKKVLIQAFNLFENKSIKFSFGGKSPDEGFDTSGFISYVLSVGGVLESSYYRVFSSSKLKELLTHVETKEVKIGDLLFYKTGLILIYLGEKKGIGIGNRDGIKFYDVDISKKCDIRRWAGQHWTVALNKQGDLKFVEDYYGGTPTDIEKTGKN